MSRRRSISPYDAGVWVPSGRWGPRRVRTTECWGVLRAEACYGALLDRRGFVFGPGTHGVAHWKLRRRRVKATFVVRENAVWRLGRVFFECPECRQRVTRLYAPLEASPLACRRCWGLTYDSRTRQNYKDSQWGRGSSAKAFGTTQRDWAHQATWDARRASRDARARRWAARAVQLRSALSRRRRGCSREQSDPLVS